MKDVVTIHAKVIADYPNAGRLYYFCRALDSNNQGWIHLHLDLAANFFGVQRRTVRRWLGKLQKKGFLRNLRNLGSHLYDVQMRNFKDIEQTVVGWSFASTKLPVRDLSDKKLTLQVAYEIAALSQQERTERAINAKVADSRKVFRPTIALSKKGTRKTSNTVRGFPNVGRGLNFFLKSTQQSYGASLRSVCHHLEKTRATVHKYTKHLERAFIWRRTNDPDKTHYTFNTKDDQGKIKEVNFEQRPSYFFSNREIKNRKCNPAAQLARKAQAEKDLKKKTVDDILRTKTKPRRSLEDKLIDLNEEQLRKLAWWIMWCIKKVDASEAIQKYSAVELLVNTANLEPVLDKDEKKLVHLLCKLIKKRKPIRRDLQDIWKSLVTS